jgi:hypothetical protein
LFLALVLFAVSTSSAMWLKMSDQELVDASPLIVKATLVRIEEKPQEAIRLGKLDVERHYKGKKHKSLFISLPSLSAPRTSRDVIYRLGQQGIWFLRQHPTLTDVYLVDNPQRYWSSEKEAKLLPLLPASKR